MIKVGVIGGSGLDDPDFLRNPEEVDMETPYGAPSSSLTCGKIDGVPMAILARHGKKHTIRPSLVNFKANIWALKEIGCTHILAATAVGSLREEIEPGHLVIPDQFIDFTKQRESTFCADNEVIHTSMAEPFCPKMRKALQESAEELGLVHHIDKTVITIEGPRFSTKAESHMFRSWNADVINMSTVPEVVLARELGIHYVTVAMSTDYDCWREGEEAVTWEMIVATMKNNSESVINLFLKTIPNIQLYDDICIG